MCAERNVQACGRGGACSSSSCSVGRRASSNCSSRPSAGCSRALRSSESSASAAYAMRPAVAATSKLNGGGGGQESGPRKFFCRKGQLSHASLKRKSTQDASQSLASVHSRHQSAHQVYMLALAGPALPRGPPNSGKSVAWSWCGVSEGYCSAVQPMHMCSVGVQLVRVDCITD